MYSRFVNKHKVKIIAAAAAIGACIHEVLELRNAMSGAAVGALIAVIFLFIMRI